MLYVFTDSDNEYQIFPEPDDSRPYILVTGDTEQRIRAGEPWRLNSARVGVVFPDPAVVEAERAAEALLAERQSMVVSRFQARAALHIAGLLAQAEQAIAGAGTLAQLAWQDAQEFRRNSPTVAAIAETLALTDEQLDDLFRQAATIEA